MWATAWGFYRSTGRDKIDRAFGLSQFILVGISYASINLTTTYINLTGPVTVGIAFFTIARLYATATGRALEQSMVRAAAARSGELHATLLLIRLDPTRNVIRPVALTRICQALLNSGTAAKSVEVLSGEQRGLWALFEYTLAVSWVADAADEKAQDAIRQDIEAVLAALPAVLRRHLAQPDNAERHFIYSRRIAGGDAARAGWRAVFAEALLEWDRQESESRMG